MIDHNIFRRDGKWYASVLAFDKILTLGPYDERERAAQAYMDKVDELHPPPLSPKVDPMKHHTMAAADIEASPIKIT